MKKIVPVIIAIIIVGGVGLYFFVFNTNQEKPEVRVEYSPGEFFTTNVGGGSSRLLKAGIILVVNENGLEDMLTRDNARIRDTIIFILRNLTEEEIKEPGTQETLRNRLITALNEKLGIDNIVEVLFNDFVMA